MERKKNLDAPQDKWFFKDMPVGYPSSHKAR